MSLIAEERQYDIGGVRTMVRTVGRGSPVIFLHGASTLEGLDAIDSLSRHFRVFYPSHPGMGKSGDAGHIVDMTDMIVHYLDLFDAMHLPEKPHLVGFSMGGWLASELAGIAREHFNKIVLVAPAGLNDPLHPAIDLASIAPSQFPDYLAHHAEIARRYFPDGTEQQALDMFMAARARENEMVARLVANHGMGHPNLHRFLRRITNPTLLIWGENDRILPASQAPLWVDALHDARLLTVPEAGHFVLLEQPLAVEKIQEFLLATTL